MNKKIFIISITLIIVLIVFNLLSNIYIINEDTNETIYEDNILKVVEVKTTDDEITWGYATGFFIDDNGTILTNRHVVFNSATSNNYNKIQVRLANSNEWDDAQIVKVSKNEDLAILKINKNKTHFFKMGSSITNGQTIYTIGNPNGFGLSFANGVVASSKRNVIYNEHVIETIQTSFVINEGNSGGSVFDTNGKLLGVICFRLKDNHDDIIQGVSFAIPVSTINAFINE